MLRQVRLLLMMAESGTGSAPVLGELLAGATRYLFFTGKGGVGKTSSAAACAVALADAGRRVLIVSTDPASNLAEVLGLPDVSTSQAQAVPGVAGLWALNVDPVAAAAAYRENVVAPYRGVLPDSAVAQIEEELSGSCTVEVAGFNEFVALLTDAEVASSYDHVVFDTAPTGHTLRLLSLPASWTGFLETNTAGVTCVGPISTLGQAQESYAHALQVLADVSLTTVVLVARPEVSTLAEAARAAGELRDLGMVHQRLIINAVLPAGADDEVSHAWRDRQEAALTAMPGVLTAAVSVECVPLLAHAPLGVDGLRAMLTGQSPTGVEMTGPAGEVESVPLAELVDQIVSQGPGVVMTMGKGGVGKSTIAAALAVALADRGLPVTLTTTDPAAHVHDVLPDPPAGLEVTRIDPVAETEAYTAAVLADAGGRMDAAALELLAEDLRSPCTEEVAVFHAFARTVGGARDRYVVIDTAPTGHTLLLLDSTRSFDKQVAKTSAGAGEATGQLFEMLGDHQRMRIIIVALAEATPVHEAQALQEDLARAGITPMAWVVNKVLAGTGTTHPLLAAQARREIPWLIQAAELSEGRLALAPWTPSLLRGAAQLRDLTSVVAEHV